MGNFLGKNKNYKPTSFAVFSLAGFQSEFKQWNCDIRMDIWPHLLSTLCIFPALFWRAKYFFIVFSLKKPAMTLKLYVKYSQHLVPIYSLSVFQDMLISNIILKIRFLPLWLLIKNPPWYSQTWPYLKIIWSKKYF